MKDWTKPHEISVLETVFGIQREDQMPSMEDIPEDFKRESDPWVKLQQTWFFRGLEGYSFEPREGVDPKAAGAHLVAIQKSFMPKHEHKEAAVAYLMSLWFESITPPNPLAV